MAVEAFLEQFTMEERLRSALKLRNDNPQKAPLLIFIDRHISTTIPSFRVLAPLDSTIGNFLQYIRIHAKLPPEQALFVFFGQERKMQVPNTIIRAVYSEEQSSDGFLYCFVMGENTFGATHA
jgi:hypothetical protein